MKPEDYRDRSFKDLSSQELWQLRQLGHLNGCGGQGSIVHPPYRIFFKASCEYHDYGYWIGGTERRRRECDRKFYQAMLEDIEMHYCNGSMYSFQRRIYLIWARLYYYGVRI